MTETKSLTFKVNATDDSLGRFSGIASTYGNRDQVNDVMVRGCFDRSIAEKGKHFPLLWSHSMDEVIGSFDVTSTEDALRIEGKFNMGVQRGKEGYALLKAGDISGLSIGFTIKDCDWDADGNRLIKEADLWEVSLVAFPCNLEAYAEAKHMKMDTRKDYSDMTEEEREKLKQIIRAALKEIAEEDEKDEDPEGKPDDAEEGESEDETEKSEEDTTEDEGKAISNMVAELKGLHQELIPHE
jgi:hypothetical protein